MAIYRRDLCEDRPCGARRVLACLDALTLTQVFGILCCLITSIVFFAEGRGENGIIALVVFSLLCADLLIGIWFLFVVKQYRDFLEVRSCC